MSVLIGMTKEQFTNPANWKVSSQNADNIYQFYGGVCYTVFKKNGCYKGRCGNTFTEEYTSQRLAESACYDLLPASKRTAAPPPAPKPAPKKMTLAEEILLAGEGDYEKGYRRLSLKFHPDAGGSHELMIALNAEIARLRKAGVN